MNEMVKLLDNAPLLNNAESNYTYNGIIVPRVTKILSKCIHSDSLMYWANSLGFKHQSYKKTLENAAEIGTYCHNNIDNYLTDNNHIINDNCPYQSINAYNSFLKWFNDINKLANIEVIYHEKIITCKYFGGTLDGLYKINNKIYLIDYKTSNNITYKYCLQLAAYRYILRNELNIEIDGCIILQLSKNNISYNEYVLNFDNPDHLKFINECETTFLSLVYAYYNIENIEYKYKLLNWEVI